MLAHMTVILDLEDTLVDTTGFKRVLFHSLEAFGVSAATVSRSYSVLRRRSEFSLPGLYRYLPTGGRPDYDGYAHALTRALGHYPYRIYPDVHWFLKRCRGIRRLLYTYGDTSVQRLKIRHLRLRPWFHRVMVTEDPTKLRGFGALIRPTESTVLIVGDRLFMEAAERRYPTVRGFCVARGQLDHTGSYPDLRAVFNALTKARLL